MKQYSVVGEVPKSLYWAFSNFKGLYTPVLQTDTLEDCYGGDLFVAESVSDYQELTDRLVYEGEVWSDFAFFSPTSEAVCYGLCTTNAGGDCYVVPTEFIDDNRLASILGYQEPDFAEKINALSTTKR